MVVVVVVLVVVVGVVLVVIGHELIFTKTPLILERLLNATCIEYYKKTGIL
jgi:hypothetical protein